MKTSEELEKPDGNGKVQKALLLKHESLRFFPGSRIYKSSKSNDLSGNQRTRQICRFSRNGKFIELQNDDCLAGLDKFHDEYFDVVVTSPPYNLGVQYDVYNDTIPRSEYLAWLEAVAIKVKQKMKDDASLFLNIGSIPTNPYGPFEVALRLSRHFYLQNTIHWIKSIYIENESYGRKESINVGHYKPLNSRRFLNDNHEYIYHFTKSGNVQLNRLAIGVPYKDNGNSLRWKNGGTGIRCRGNTWYVPYKTIHSRARQRPHPATFPSEIAELCIKLHGLKDDLVVLDPFMGIGNTSIACARLNTNCVGFEIDSSYFEVNLELIRSTLGHDLDFSESDPNAP